MENLEISLEKSSFDYDEIQSVRYTDEKLKIFKENILKKLKKEKDHLSILTLPNNGTEDTSRSFEISENAQDQKEKEELQMNIARSNKLITNLENALARVEDKTYGICRITKKLIPEDRMHAVPHATLSVEGKEIEKSQKNSERYNRSN